MIIILNRNVYLVIACMLIFTNVVAQTEIKLSVENPNPSQVQIQFEAQDANGFVTNISEPRMYAFLASPADKLSAAVLICPGGGYFGISSENEGLAFAHFLNKNGISAFVLYYRMPNGQYELPLQDAQSAIRAIRQNAHKWHIDKHKIGIAGFSAGGHLASTVGTQFTTATRPDFMALMYPVISMDKVITHRGSRTNLLGKNPSEALVERFSSEIHVGRKTPPTFLLITLDDTSVPVENSYRFYKALQANDVPSELNTFAKGGHGFGMQKSGLDVDNWTDLLLVWLKNRKFIN
jgi:acetyl esterase/lipase